MKHARQTPQRRIVQQPFIITVNASVGLPGAGFGHLDAQPALKRHLTPLKGFDAQFSAEQGTQQLGRIKGDTLARPRLYPCTNFNSEPRNWGPITPDPRLWLLNDVLTLPNGQAMTTPYADRKFIGWAWIQGLTASVRRSRFDSTWMPVWISCSGLATATVLLSLWD